MKNPRINESLIIGVDFSERDNGVLIALPPKERRSYNYQRFSG